MKIVKMKFDGGSLSAPAFLDIELEDGTMIMLKGKVAKRVNARYKEGDEYNG